MIFKKGFCLVILFILSCIFTSYDNKAIATNLNDPSIEFDQGKVAKISIDSSDQAKSSGPLMFVGIDKKRTSFSKGYNLLEPGKHTIQISNAFASFGMVSCYLNLWLVAEAGKKYVVKSECIVEQNKGDNTSSRYFRCWIEDASSGKPVGGFVGSSDEPE